MGFDARLDYDRDHLLNRISDMESQTRALSQELEVAHRLATLGTLLGIVAHEFNNLLTPVSSYAQLALANPDDRELVAKALTRAVDGTEQVTRIAGAILGFVREDQQMGTADVNRVVDETILCLGRDPRKQGVIIERDIPVGLRVAMRPICLQQVLLNLFMNAIEAMRPHGGYIRVSTRNDDPSGEVVLSVSDTGKGMSPEFVSRVFEPLFVKARTNDERQGGHGFGLLICRRLVNEAGGEIAVQSEMGRGTTFTLRLTRAANAV